MVCLILEYEDTFGPSERRYQRLPLQCNPEAVLMQSGLEAPSVAAFLHENMPDFIADNGMESAADVFGYLSESGT